ncbi:hypothetical protein BH18ACT3_BH18ACT3_21440 [soil metagenome]
MVVEGPWIGGRGLCGTVVVVVLGLVVLVRGTVVVERGCVVVVG